MALVLLWLIAIWSLAATIHREKIHMQNLLKSIWGIFGKNQWIGVGIYGSIIVIACVGTYMSAVTTVTDLLGFLQWFGPSAVASLTLPSAAVKMRNGVTIKGVVPATTNAPKGGGSNR